MSADVQRKETQGEEAESGPVKADEYTGRRDRYGNPIPDVSIVSEPEHRALEAYGADVHPDMTYATVDGPTEAAKQRYRQEIGDRGFRPVPKDRDVHMGGLPHAEIWAQEPEFARAHQEREQRAADRRARELGHQARDLRRETQAMAASAMGGTVDGGAGAYIVRDGRRTDMADGPEDRDPQRGKRGRSRSRLYQGADLD